MDATPIWQAQGILAARYGLTMDAAMDRLIDCAAEEHRSIEEVALDLVNGPQLT